MGSIRRKSTFKRCGCGSVWEERESFICDNEIIPTGMTFLARTRTPKLFFFFNHEKCKSTLAINAEEFADCIKEPIHSKLMTGEEECPGYCANVESLEKCRNECRNAPYRRLLLDLINKKDT